MTADDGIQDHRRLQDWSTVTNKSELVYEDLPIDMRFNEGHMLSIVGYGILMVLSAVGNCTVLYLIISRRRKTPSRINLMLMHLAIADLLVTFLLMPLEIAWAATVSWWAGDAMCRIMSFFRMFGLYLSSFILVCISIDRYYAVVKPLHFSGKNRRVKYMLAAAWMASTLCSIPQMVVFHEEAHPNMTFYKQCVTFNVFSTPTNELLYRMFGAVTMYIFPLLIIFFAYGSTFVEIYKRARESTGGTGIRRSSLGFLGRAKIQTLKMTIVIVMVFIICWTPYYVMCFWYWFDRDTAIKVDQRIQKGLFLFACTNSCMNPLVYGAFNIRGWKASGQKRASTASRLGRSSVRQRTEVTYLVSDSIKSTERRRDTSSDMCYSCGETFEMSAADAVSLTSTRGK